LREDELPAADQRLRQGAQVFFLDEVTAHHRLGTQLCVQRVKIESLCQRDAKQRQQQAEYLQQTARQVRIHASTFCTAATNTGGEANSISRLAMSTATCTELPRVMRSPVSASRIR